MLVEGRMLSPWDGFRSGEGGGADSGEDAAGEEGCRGEDAAAGCEEDAVMNGKEDDLIPL